MVFGGRGSWVSIGWIGGDICQVCGMYVGEERYILWMTRLTMDYGQVGG
jgi:hypothetical protein